ncbi:MAG: DUF1294 domain-containing protein [Acidaminococcaceae bacterium]
MNCKWLGLGLLLWNVFTALLLGLDKWRAVKQQYRVPERTLFAVALGLGALGVWLGMRVFHHKTCKLQFRYGIPCCVVWNLWLLYQGYNYFSK